MLQQWKRSLHTSHQTLSSSTSLMLRTTSNSKKCAGILYQFSSACGMHLTIYSCWGLGPSQCTFGTPADLKKSFICMCLACSSCHFPSTQSITLTWGRDSVRNGRMESLATGRRPSSSSTARWNLYSSPIKIHSSLESRSSMIQNTRAIRWTTCTRARRRTCKRSCFRYMSKSTRRRTRTRQSMNDLRR